MVPSNGWIQEEYPRREWIYLSSVEKMQFQFLKMHFQRDNIVRTDYGNEEFMEYVIEELQSIDIPQVQCIGSDRGHIAILGKWREKGARYYIGSKLLGKTLERAASFRDVPWLPRRIATFMHLDCREELPHFS